MHLTVPNYYNKKGELVTYRRCARVDKKVTMYERITMLNDIAKEYLTHHFYIASNFGQNSNLDVHILFYILTTAKM